MRLLGKYTFETLRDCLQGVFDFRSFYDTDMTLYYELDIWQLHATICPHKYVELSINMGDTKTYKSLGKIELS